MGTTILKGFLSDDKKALRENLSGDAFTQACQALASVANTLNLLAGAISKGGFVQPVADSLSLTHEAISIGDAVRQFLAAKARVGRSDRYVRALRVSLRSFAKGRFTKPLESITPKDLEAWLDKEEWAARTRAGYLADVSTLFNYFRRRSLVSHNPTAAVELPAVDDKSPCVHSPRQVAAALEYARACDLNLCRCLALRYFAGLRSIEVERSEEANIRDGHFEVTSEHAKRKRGRRRRLVTIQPNLRAWLELGGTIEFGDMSNRFREFTAKLRAASGMAWPANVTRHTFVSYHMASFADARKTGNEAGHTEQMVYSTYREIACLDGSLITPALAAEFWAIRPK